MYNPTNIFSLFLPTLKAHSTLAFLSALPAFLRYRTNPERG
jgi:hypothetical protein